MMKKNSLTGCSWFNINYVLLNSKKTKYNKFSPPNIKQIIMAYCRMEKGWDLWKKQNVWVDLNLHWGPHIDRLASILSSVAFAIKTIRAFSDIEPACIVYYSYFQSVISTVLRCNVASVITGHRGIAHKISL